MEFSRFDFLLLFVYIICSFFYIRGKLLEINLKGKSDRELAIEIFDCIKRSDYFFVSQKVEIKAGGGLIDMLFIFSLSFVFLRSNVFCLRAGENDKIIGHIVFAGEFKVNIRQLENHISSLASEKFNLSVLA